MGAIAERRELLCLVASNNGTELTSYAVLSWCQDIAVGWPPRSGTSWIYHFAQAKLVEGPQQNIFVELFNGCLRDECLNAHLLPTLAAARRIIKAWRMDFNIVRPNGTCRVYELPRQERMDTEAKLSAT